MTFYFAWNVISKVIENNNIMKEEMIEDMTFEDGETEKYIK
jgi:hypothetical protein